jgi:phage terminase large subunit-like protein
MPRDFPAIAAQYAADVLSGKQVASKLVKLACQRQIDDLARQEDESFAFRFEPQLATRVCWFVEQAPHIKGKLRGRRIRLEPWQVFILTTVFGWINKDTGKRRFRRVYIECPRGSGKSCFSSPIGLYMAFADNEGGAEVYSCATTRDQAKIVFSAAQDMARQMPQFLRRSGQEVEVTTASIHQQSSASFFRALASEANSLDGLNIHCAIVDELHAHPNRELWDVIETGLGKRDQSLLWAITTAGTNQSGICYEIHSYIKKIIERIIVDESWFGIIYSCDEEDPWDAPETARKANPNYGVSVFPDELAQMVRKAQNIASAQPAYQTKHLNRWCNANSAWMNMAKWNACADPTLNEAAFETVPCIIGLDLASKLDLLSAVRLHWKDIKNEETGRNERHYYVFHQSWLPQETIAESINTHLYGGWIIDGHLIAFPGATNDYDAIEEYVRDNARRYPVQEVAHDQYNATSIVNHLMPEGITMVEVPQRTPFLSPAMKELEAAVADGRFHHNGDPLLTWAVSNVVAHPDKNDNLFPNKETQDNKIDPCTALLTATNRAMNADVNSSGDWDGEILWA